MKATLAILTIATIIGVSAFVRREVYGSWKCAVAHCHIVQIEHRDAAYWGTHKA